jgi:glyoxylase-like metal-dependent hydrolase (beta-lactamase superfamily II)
MPVRQLNVIVKEERTLPYEDISPGLVRIRGRPDENGMPNSSFVIFDEKVAVIDTGAQGELWKEVIDVIKQHGKNPKQHLKHILLTHEHPDHFGSAAELKNATGAEVSAHSAAAETLRDPSRLVSKHFDVSQGSSGIVRKLKSAFGKVTAVDPDSILDGGEKIELGRSTLTVVHTGSHCAGHTMFYDDYRRALFTGDEIVESPSNPCKYIIDLTGSAERRELILNRLFGLKIDLLIPSHDSPSIGESVKEQINRAIDANDVWKKEVYDAVDRLGEATTEEIANSVKGALSLDWAGDLKPVAATLTTTAYLKALSTKRRVGESDKKKDGRTLWVIR